MLNRDIKSEFKELCLLVVDDESVALDEMSKILKKNFKKVHLAEDGQKALDVFKKEKESIDIVVTDISMPNKNGLALAKDIKTLDSNTPIVIITAYSEIEYLHEAIDVGIDQFIQKPIDPRKLFESLHKCSNTVLANKNKEQLELNRYKEIAYNSKKELLKDIAHHWRNPLNALNLIVANADDILELADSYSELKKELKIYCDNAQTQINRMSDIVDNFISCFNSANEVSDVPIQSSFLTIWEIIDNSFPDIDCDLRLEVSEDMSINIDRSSINYIFYQVVKNSFEEFERREIQSPVFKLYSKELDNHHRLFFEDNAGGLSTKSEDRIFMPYSSDKSVESCRGVSLFLVKKTLVDKKIFVDYKNIKSEGFILFIDIPKAIQE
ncbi:MAG: response regulator [Campylobacterales bacterium]